MNDSKELYGYIDIIWTFGKSCLDQATASCCKWSAKLSLLPATLWEICINTIDFLLLGLNIMILACWFLKSVSHYQSGLFLCDFEWPEIYPGYCPKKCLVDYTAPMGILLGSGIVSSVASRAYNNGWCMYKVCWISWGICPIVFWPLRNRLSTVNQWMVFLNLRRERERSLEDVQIIRFILHPTHLLFIRFNSIDSKPSAQVISGPLWSLWTLNRKCICTLSANLPQNITDSYQHLLSVTSVADYWNTAVCL